MSHNGYTNYSTWSVSSTIDNVESLYNCFKDAVKEVKTQYQKDERVPKLARILRNTVESMMPNTNNSIWGPLINNECSLINYYEIAQHMLEDY